MFWDEDVRFCKDCKHWQTKDWSVWSECKLGRKTPSGGSTAACDQYEQQFTWLGGNYHCKDCARWEESFLSSRCIKKLPTPKGRDSGSCKYVGKG